MCAPDATYSRGAALAEARAMTPNADDRALEACLAEAEGHFMASCCREDIPAAAEGLVARMARHLYGQLDGAGLSAQSYSGASETFLNDWPEDLKRAMNRFRRLVMR